MINVNDGNGLSDKYGMIDNLVKLAENIEIKGANNAKLLYLLVQGLIELKNGMKKEEQNDNADACERRED